MPRGVYNRNKDTMPEEVKIEAQQEMVSVKKEKLDELLNRLSRLESAASKAGLSHYDEQHKGEKQTIIRLKTIDGKVIISWDAMLKNTVEKNERGGWYEEQSIKLNYEDGTNDVMPYVFFVRRYKFLPAVLVSETINRRLEDVEKFGDRIFELEVDGKTYKVGSKFVN
jgi:hypothetical protein